MLVAEIRSIVFAVSLGLCSATASAQSARPPTASAPASPAAVPGSTTPSTPGAPAPAATGSSDTSAQTEAEQDPITLQAREVFRLGSSLAKQGQWNEALAAFERSASLRAHPVTTYNIGYVERALGRYTRAYKSLNRALAEKAEGTGATLPDNLVTEARSYLAEINQRLAHVSVTIESGTAVSIDGRPLEPWSDEKGRMTLLAGTRVQERPEVPPATTFDLLIDPGVHVIMMARAGARDVMVNRTFDSGSANVLELRISEPQTKPARRRETTATTTKPEPDRTWMYVAYGIGAAGIVTGSTFGILAISKDSQLADACPNQQCQPDKQGDLDTLHTYTSLSTIGFVVGAIGAAAGTYFLLTTDDTTEPEARPRATSSVRVRPFFSPVSAGVLGEF